VGGRLHGGWLARGLGFRHARRAGYRVTEMRTPFLRDPLAPAAGAAGRVLLAAVLLAVLWALVWWARQ